jgi:hypothetical protein
MTVPKILPYQGGEDVRGFIRAAQEESIQRMIQEFQWGSRAVCNGSTMDSGKTLCASEVVVRLGLERVLYIGIKDTYEQWVDRLAAQSDGRIELRRVDSTVKGKKALADMLAGRPGHFFAGSQYLTRQDWDYVPKLDSMGKKVWKTEPKNVVKNGVMLAAKGAVVTRPVPAGEIGPQLLPVQDTEPVQKRIYKKMAPLQMVIFDEVHAVANRHSQGRKTLITIPTITKLGMSGTWMGNKFQNAWSITRWLWPDIIDGNFKRWSERWCTTSTIFIAGGEEKQVPGGERNEGEFVSTLPCYVRIDAEREVPEPEIVEVDLLPEQRADYDDLERDLLLWLQTPAGSRACLVADLPITLRARLRAATLGTMMIDENGDPFFPADTRSTKLTALRGILDRPGWSGRQVGIYTESKRFAHVMAARMNASGYSTRAWTGDASSKEREEIKRAWLAGEFQYLISTIQSFSTGLDGFQAAANRVVWVSESDNNVLNQQAVRRYFRSGNEEMLNDFQHVKIVARDTYDMGVLSKNVLETLSMHATLTLAA